MLTVFDLIMAERYRPKISLGTLSSITLNGQTVSQLGLQILVVELIYSQLI